MRSYDIYKELKYKYNRQNYILLNTFVFRWESDFLTTAKQTNYVTEVEVKVSRADFKNDFNKTVGYSNIKKHNYLLNSKETFKPNKFIFACPVDIIKLEDIPNEYGLYYVTEEKGIKEIRHPKFLHKEDLYKNIGFVRQMMNKYYYRNLELKRQLEIKEVDIKYGQRRLYDKSYY